MPKLTLLQSRHCNFVEINGWFSHHIERRLWNFFVIKLDINFMRTDFLWSKGGDVALWDFLCGDFPLLAAWIGDLDLAGSIRFSGCWGHHRDWAWLPNLDSCEMSGIKSFGGVFVFSNATIIDLGSLKRNTEPWGKRCFTLFRHLKQ